MPRGPLLVDVIETARRNGCKAESVNPVSLGLPPNICLARISGKLFNLLDAQKPHLPADSQIPRAQYGLSINVLAAVDGTICRLPMPDAFLVFDEEAKLLEIIFPKKCKRKRKIFTVPLVTTEGHKPNKLAIEPWLYLNAWPKRPSRR